jgi:thiol-disulfide isomerase/thioredoxin
MTRGWGRVSATLLLLLAVGAAPLQGQAGELPAVTPHPESGLVSWGDADFRWRVRSLEQGKATSLDGFRGEVLFINLWASWCLPCVRELASIERLRTRLADTDITFLMVAPEGEEPVRRFLRRHRYHLPFYLEASRMPPSWGLRGLPTTWVVDRHGRVVLLRHGEAVWDTDVVEAFLRGLVEG